MTNYREILRLHSLSYSRRRIEASVHSSHQTVRAVIESAEIHDLKWPLEESITNAELEKLLFPNKKVSKVLMYAEPDYPYIHKELSKKGVTLTLLWNEYCERCRANGEIPYMSTQFCDKYRRWARVTKATMRINHKPGETMQVDWAGGTIPYYDSVTGEEFKAYLFVAVLPCSGIIYVEACEDMKQENWLLCHVHAYEYFGGVTRILVPDNLKTGVTANTRYETQLNESYRELAEHYGTAIIPARVRHPQDKGLVERSVGFSTTWITAAMRERKFYSITEVKEAVAERLEIINKKPFQKLPGCRKDAYLNEEKEFMQPLPATSYEPAIWLQATVGNDYLISDGKNKYSVPFDLIGEKVQIRLTRNVVEVFFKGSRMTSHERLSFSRMKPVVKTDHMPDNHKKYLNYNADEFMKWADDIGKSVADVVGSFLNTGSVPEQGYKSCISLMKLCERYGKKKLNNVCERILGITSVPTVRNIASLLNNYSNSDMEEKTSSGEKYGITRGAAYYSRKGGNRND